ncbi:MAG: prepilin peptidase [Spirochaetota bacterium]
MLHFAPAHLAVRVDALAVVFLVGILLPVLVCEIRDRRIPDRIVVALLVAAAAKACLATIPAAARFPAPLLDLAAGVAIPLVARRFTAGGLGWGDVKLSAALCVFAGARTGAIGLMLGCALAIAGVAAGRVVDGCDASSEAGVPFGPYMVAGVILAMQMEMVHAS